MRGRKPRPVLIPDHDKATLEAILRSHTRPWFVIRRARILLGIASGRRVGEVAAEAGCDAATAWRVCRRYEQRGIQSVLVLATRGSHSESESTAKRHVKPAFAEAV